MEHALSVELDEARGLFAAGDDKKAIAALGRLESTLHSRMIDGTLDRTNKDDADGIVALALSIRGRNDGGIRRKAASLVVDAQGYLELIARRPVPVPGALSDRRVPVQRADQQKLIESLVRRAGIVEPAPIGAGTFAGEAIVILHGHHESSLDLFDQHGKQIGSAERSRGRYSRDGYQYRYELLGIEPGFTVTDISKGRFVSIPKDFTIVGVDGSQIASARRGSVERRSRSSHDVPREQPWKSFVFERGRETLATLREMPRKEFRRTRPRPSPSNPIESFRMRSDRLFGSQLFHLEDQSSRQAARITYLPGAGVGYILELQPDVPELLSTISVAACLIADNAFVSPGGNGGGGS